MPPTQLQRGFGGLDPLGHRLHAPEDLAQLPAAAQLDADVPVAAEATRTRQDQVAEPAQPGQRLTAPTQRARQPGDLRQPARHECRQGVRAQAQPLDHPGRDRDDVLHGATDFDADDVVARIEPEVRSPELLLNRSRHVRPAAGHQNRGGQPPRDLGPEARARQHGHRSGRAQLLLYDLRHAIQGTDLEPFRAADDHRIRAQQRGHATQQFSCTVGRYRHDDAVNRTERLL